MGIFATNGKILSNEYFVMYLKYFPDMTLFEHLHTVWKFTPEENNSNHTSGGK